MTHEPTSAAHRAAKYGYSYVGDDEPPTPKPDPLPRPTPGKLGAVPPRVNVTVTTPAPKPQPAMSATASPAPEPENPLVEVLEDLKEKLDRAKHAAHVVVPAPRRPREFLGNVAERLGVDLTELHSAVLAAQDDDEGTGQ